MTAETTATIQPYIPLLSAVAGGLIGGIVSVAGQLIVHYVKEKPIRDLEVQQKKLLKLMLDPKNMPTKSSSEAKATWRTFQALSNVIGADEVTAKRMLIEIGARRSMGKNDVWAFIEDKPLDNAEKDTGDSD